jgi:hypothetical protein
VRLPPSSPCPHLVDRLSSSWSPRGVLTAALNSASFRLNSRKIDVPGAQLLQQHFPSVSLLPGFAFEGVANRDSVKYLCEYGLEGDLPTILRGTLRYPGFARQVDAFKKLGLLSTEKLPESVKKWDGLVDACLGEKGFDVVDEASRRAAFLDILGNEKLVDEVLLTLDRCVTLTRPPLPSVSPCPFALSQLFPAFSPLTNFCPPSTASPSFPPRPLPLPRRFRLSLRPLKRQSTFFPPCFRTAFVTKKANETL